jgi:flagellar FliL protein
LTIAAAALVLVAGGITAGYLVGTDSNAATPAAPPTATTGEIQKSGSATDPAKLGPMIDLESFIVNILDEQGTRYLKAAITLETDQEKTATEVKERLPQIRDAILLLVGNKTFGELSDLQGKLQLRADLTSRLNQILQTGKVARIYFTEFVVQ